MKKLVAAAAAAAFSVVPVLAQEIKSYTEQQVADAAAAIEAAALTDTLYQNLWCGAAFVIINQLATNKGMTEQATSAMGAADVLYGKAATEAIAAGVPEADFTALSQNFRIVAISQTGPDAEADYTQEDCVAAVQAP